MSISKVLSIKICLLVVFINCSSQSIGQQVAQFSKEFKTTVDNDFFLLSGSDRYYTNGLSFTLSSISKKISQNKIIDQFELGQKIYNAYKRKIPPENVAEIDRPIAGYLYFSFVQKHFSKNSMWYWGIAPGIIGPAALGKEVQSGWHSIIGIQSKWDWVWKYQVKNELGLNTSVGYDFVICQPASFFQISSESEVTLGTIFTGAKQSVVFQIGKFNNIDASAQWGSLINKKGQTPSHSEIYLFIRPSLTCQIYNATIQGGLFRKDKGPIVSEINPLIFSNDLGISASKKQFTISLILTALQKEAHSQFNNHIYGSMVGCYRFNK